VTPTQTVTPTLTPTPTSSAINCPTGCGVTIDSSRFISSSTEPTGQGVYSLGGYCMENPGVDTQGESWWYTENSCEVINRQYSGGSSSSCIGQYVTPTGTVVSSVTHSVGVLNPTGTNVLYDTGIRFIDSNNNAIFVIVEWDQSLLSVESVHILCDCTFEGDIEEVN